MSEIASLKDRCDGSDRYRQYALAGLPRRWLCNGA
jgi:hypothetical protein